MTAKLLAACEVVANADRNSEWTKYGATVTSSNPDDDTRAENYVVFLSRAEMDAIRNAIAEAKRTVGK